MTRRLSSVTCNQVYQLILDAHIVHTRVAYCNSLHEYDVPIESDEIKFSGESHYRWQLIHFY